MRTTYLAAFCFVAPGDAETQETRVPQGFFVRYVAARSAINFYRNPMLYLSDECLLARSDLAGQGQSGSRL